MQTFVAQVGRLPPEDARAIRAKVPAEVWQRIESAGALSWLPIDVNLACTHAVAECLEPQRAHKFFRELLRITAESPLLLALVEAVLRVTVVDPGLYLASLPRGYALMFREMGKWEVLERVPGRAVLELRDLPANIVTDRIWVGSVASSLWALFDIGNLEGQVRILEVDTNARRVTFRMEWSAR
jgi:hypothetical protein